MCCPPTYPKIPRLPAGGKAKCILVFGKWQTSFDAVQRGPAVLLQRPHIRPPSNESPCAVDPPRMRVSRSSVELLGTPRCGLGVHISTPLRELHSHSHSRSRSRSHSRAHSHSRYARPAVPSSPIFRRNSHTTGYGSTPDADLFAPLNAAYTQDAPAGDGSGHEPSAPNRYSVALDALLAALRQDDTVRLYFCLLDLTRGASVDNELFRRTVQSIPATVFSEILRNFDPVNIANRVDSAPGINITFGAALYTPLGELVNKWGVKVLYVQILNRLRLVQQARRRLNDRRTRPLLNDYALFLRFAGATSDVTTAKAFWRELRTDGYTDFDHTALYADFLKARYLTESLYANNDLARLRLRPLDLHRSSITLPPHVVIKLKRLNGKLTDLAKHRFGQNVNEPYFAEPLTRRLRKRAPLEKIKFNAVRRGMIPGNANLVCTILKANGRVGAIEDSIRLLNLCWNIKIVRHKETGAVHVEGGADVPPGSAQAPTEALLDAVVHCFANASEISLATKLVDFISRRFGVPVPDSVWSDLLEFARIMQTKPAATEWEIADFADKEQVDGNTVLDIWNLCTQEPHNFKPGMSDYYNLTKTIISSKKEMSAPLEAMRNIRPLYGEAVQEMQDAWCELILTTKQGLPNHAAYRRYRVAQSRKYYTWYCLHYATRQMLAKVKPGRLDDNNAVRHIPDIIGEFGLFLAAEIKYTTPTGTVELQSDTSRLKPLQFTQEVEEPRPISERSRPTQWFRDDVGLEQVLSEGETPSQVDTSAAEGHEPPNAPLPVQEGQQSAEAQESMDKAEDETVVELGMGEKSGNVHVSDTFPPAQDPEDDDAGQPVADSPKRLLPNMEQLPPADPFEEAFRSAFQEDFGVNSLAQPSEDNWDEPPTEFAKRKDVRGAQLVERPAYMFRPPYSAPPAEMSLSALRANNMEFTGFHDSPEMMHFAAHKVVRSMKRDVGVPVDLDAERWKKELLMKHLLWMKT